MQTSILILISSMSTLPSKYLFIFSPFILSNDMIEQIPLILDPITYLNAGKSSFRIEDIKACFSKTSAALYNLVFKSNTERNNIISSLFEQKMIGLIQK